MVHLVLEIVTPAVDSSGLIGFVMARQDYLGTYFSQACHIAGATSALFWVTSSRFLFIKYNSNVSCYIRSFVIHCPLQIPKSKSSSRLLTMFLIDLYKDITYNHRIVRDFIIVCNNIDQH